MNVLQRSLHKTLKEECIPAKTPLSLDDARMVVSQYTDQYNNVRLRSAIGCIAPADKLNGKDKEIFEELDQKLGAAREQQIINRQQTHQKINISEDTLNLLTQAA